jgi:hypothetical protein
VHARVLRPRGVPAQLALSLDGVLPSAQGDSVGTPVWLISGLHSRPARTPTNASWPALRLTPHSSGPVWIASPSPYDSCIRFTSPLIPAQPPSRGDPPLDGASPNLRIRNRRTGTSVTSERGGCDVVASRPTETWRRWAHIGLKGPPTASRCGAYRYKPTYDGGKHVAGGRRGKERVASLLANQRLAAGGRRLPRPV